MAGVLDSYVTRLILEHNVAKAAAEVKAGSKSIEEDLEDVERQAKETEQALDGISSVGDLVRQSFVNAAGDVLGANQAFQGVIQMMGGQATAAGTAFGNAMSGVATAMIGPQGVAVAIGVVGVAITGLTATVSFGAGFISGAFNALMSQAGMLASTFTQVLAPSLVRPFTDAAEKVDTLRRGLTGMLGGAAAGESVMQFLQQFGLTSPLPQESLQRTAVTLGQVGFDANQIKALVPALNDLITFGSLGAGTPELSAQVMNNVIMKAAGGAMGEAIEGLRSMGINRLMLEERGITFNGGGQMTSRFEELMAALVDLARDSRVERTVQEIAGSDAVRGSNIQDTFTLAMVEAGKAFNAAFLPVMEAGAGLLRLLVQDGTVKAIAESLASIAAGDGLGMKRVVAMTAAILENLPVLFGAIEETITRILGDIVKALRIFWESTAGIANVLVGRKSWEEGENYFKDRQSDFRKRIAPITDRYNQFMAMTVGEAAPPERAEANDTSPNLAGNAPHGLQQTASAQLVELQRIRENTARMDVRRLILGGGELARQGITAADLSDFRGRGPRLDGDRLALDLAEVFRRYVGAQLDSQRRATSGGSQM